GFRQQCRDLRQRPIAFLGPAGAFADIGEMQVDIAAERRARLCEEGRFLRAGDENGLLTGARGLEGSDLRAAQGAVDAALAHSACLCEVIAIDTHLPVAIADEDGLAVQFHAQRASEIDWLWQTAGKGARPFFVTRPSSLKPS